MRTMLVCAVVVVCAAGLVAQDKKYEKEGKFTAKFPSGPVEQTKAAGGLKMHIFFADHDKGKGGFLVTYSDLPPEPLRATKPEQVLDSSEKGLVDSFKAKITKSTATTVGTKKHPAREITAEREEWHMHGKVILVGTRMYQVYVFGTKEFTTSTAADEFLASFAITD